MKENLAQMVKPHNHLIFIFSMHDLLEEDWALLYMGLVEDFMEKVKMAEWI